MKALGPVCQFRSFYRLLVQATSSEWEHTLPEEALAFMFCALVSFNNCGGGGGGTLFGQLKNGQLFYVNEAQGQ